MGYRPNPVPGQFDPKQAFKDAFKLESGDLLLPGGILVPNPDERRPCEVCGYMMTRRALKANRRTGKTTCWGVICKTCYEATV